MSLIRLRNIEKQYDGPSPVLALSDVDLDIDRGEFVAVVGPSGSGKSTLLNILALLDQPTKGVYAIDGREVGEASDLVRAKLRSRWFAFVFQAFHLLESRTVLANVEMGLMYRHVDPATRQERALEAIDFVGLSAHTHQAVNKLSGGQRQRVAIARAITAGAPVLVADEPTGSLDSVTSNKVMEVFERLQARGTTIVLVTHDPNVANRALRRIQVFDGQVSDLANPLDQVTLEAVYTEAEDDPTGPLPVIAPEAHPSPSEANSQAVIAEIEGTEDAEDAEAELEATLAAADDALEATADPTIEDALAEDDPDRLGRDSAIAFKEIVADAWASLTDYPRRMVGMVIAVALGVAMSLATLGIGQSASSQVSSSFDAARSTKVTMQSPVDNVTPEIIRALTSFDTLTRLKNIAGVERVAATISYGAVNAVITPGADPEEVHIVSVPDLGGILQKYRVEWAGTTQTLGDHDVLLGAEAARQLNIGPIALSPTIRLNGRLFRVAGLVHASGFEFEILGAAMVTPAAADQLGIPQAASFEMTVKPGAAQQVAKQAPIALWPRDPDAIYVDAPPDPQNMREEIEGSITTMLYTLTGVSIFAAIVALTNAMTTAVGRRTGEFGLRRAMGARRRHIATLVALESAMLGGLGGIVGTVLALLAILAVTLYQRWVPVFDLQLIPLGLGGGIVVGVFSALAAMFRAASIEPADALRR